MPGILTMCLPASIASVLETHQKASPALFTLPLLTSMKMRWLLGWVSWPGLQQNQGRVPDLRYGTGRDIQAENSISLGRMKKSPENIHPDFDVTVSRKEKEKLLQQHAKVIWMTGLSGSGKSTIAKALEHELFKRNHVTTLLDGDNMRTGINSNLKFSLEDRFENIRRAAEASKLFLHTGIITINSTISPTREIRKMAQEIIGENDYIEIYINCPLEICEQRDVKGLYAKARNGEIENFTGISAPFEEPEAPHLEIKTDQLDVDSSVESLLNFILPKISYK